MPKEMYIKKDFVLAFSNVLLVELVYPTSLSRTKKTDLPIGRSKFQDEQSRGLKAREAMI